MSACVSRQNDAFRRTCGGRGHAQWQICRALYTPVEARHVPASVNRDQSTIQKNFPPNLTNHHSDGVNRPQLAVRPIALLLVLVLLPPFFLIYFLYFCKFFFPFGLCLLWKTRTAE